MQRSWLALLLLVGCSSPSSPDSGQTGGGGGSVTTCATAHGGCDALATCTDTASGPTCGPCPAGYRGAGATACVDVDECATGNGGCSAGTTCHNTLGSFSCESADGGTCSVSTCPQGTCCGGRCVDTQSSSTDCGGCGLPCTSPTPNTVAQCGTGSCRIACALGFFDCDGNAATGCESNVACTCTPGSMTGCYEGAAGTEDVGPCHAGVKTCLPTGAGYGACVGQVLPTPSSAPTTSTRTATARSTTCPTSMATGSPRVPETAAKRPRSARTPRW